jgi:hypothetical protein
MRLGTLTHLARGATVAALALSALSGSHLARAQLPVAEERSIEGVRVELRWNRAELHGDPARVRAWIERSTHVVRTYYGRFPVETLTLLVRVGDGARVGGGTTFGMPAPLIRLALGRDVSEPVLRDDWVLVHEMTHLALPDVGEAHAWLSEGIATYVEGVARVQAHARTAEDVFAEDVRQMPRGLPQPGDAGLDHTHTWGRTYWGGALFCLLADVDIRRASGNRLGLQDALRAIARASGGLNVEWPIERVLAVGDEAVGTRVLESLYQSMKDRPVATDLPSLWRSLGVEPTAEGVRFDARAPLAPIREAILRSPDERG